jgi:thiol-disulfide isomerase/thioredoxin
MSTIQSIDLIEWQARLGQSLGHTATFVQFSSAFCAPCRTTRLVLADISAKEEGVSHIDLDAESHLDLVRELKVLATPTTIILDGLGRTILRVTGTPRKDRVLDLLARIRETAR